MYIKQWENCKGLLSVVLFYCSNITCWRFIFGLWATWYCWTQLSLPVMADPCVELVQLLYSERKEIYLCMYIRYVVTLSVGQNLWSIKFLAQSCKTYMKQNTSKAEYMNYSFKSVVYRKSLAQAHLCLNFEKKHMYCNLLIRKPNTIILMFSNKPYNFNLRPCACLYCK